MEIAEGFKPIGYGDGAALERKKNPYKLLQFERKTPTRHVSLRNACKPKEQLSLSGTSNYEASESNKQRRASVKFVKSTKPKLKSL